MGSPFGWDYPAGVTGNEPELAGGLERDMQLQCEQVDVSVVPSFELKAALANLQARIGKMHDSTAGKAVAMVDVLAEEMQVLIDRVDTLEDRGEWECPFDGDVEVDVFGDLGRWTCPVCGSENEVDLTPDEPERDDWEDD